LAGADLGSVVRRTPMEVLWPSGCSPLFRWRCFRLPPRLGAGFSFAEPFPDKPPGMHWRNLLSDASGRWRVDLVNNVAGARQAFSAISVARPHSDARLARRRLLHQYVRV
jgi:hypothetical protein